MPGGKGLLDNIGIAGALGAVCRRCFDVDGALGVSYGDKRDI